METVLGVFFCHTNIYNEDNPHISYKFLKNKHFTIRESSDNFHKITTILYEIVTKSALSRCQKHKVWPIKIRQLDLGRKLFSWYSEGKYKITPRVEA